MSWADTNDWETSSDSAATHILRQSDSNALVPQYQQRNTFVRRFRG
jgi:hypothetical protein